MADKIRKSDLSENFSLIRFAEYRPSTFTADYTLEIPTLAQFITDETFQPVNLVVWLELTSLTLKNVHVISTRLEEFIAKMIEVGKDIFRNFPPISGSFTLTIHLLQYNFTTQVIQTEDLTKAFEQINNQLYKGLAWEIEKWIIQQGQDFENHPDFDLTRWNLKQCIKLVIIYIF